MKSFKQWMVNLGIFICLCLLFLFTGFVIKTIAWDIPYEAGQESITSQFEPSVRSLEWCYGFNAGAKFQAHSDGFPNTYGAYANRKLKIKNEEALEKAIEKWTNP